MIKPLSIMIYLPNMHCGGVERVALNLCQSLLALGLNVTLALNEKKGELLSQVPRGATIISLDSTRTLDALPRLIHCLKREQPDVLLSGLGHNNIVAIWAKCLAGVKTAVVIGQHNALSSESSSSPSWQHRILPLLYRIFSRFADGILAVSKGVADDMAAQCGIPREKISVIYNPVVTSRSGDSGSCTHSWLADKDVPVFVGIGRLVLQKNFQLLIRAFATLSNRYRARLIIIGDGPLRQELKGLACRLGVADAVDLIGYRQDPYPYFEHAAAVVLPSRFEGFGNVLVESMSCGTPVISTDCPFGPSEILANGDYGLLVPIDDPGSMADAMALTLTRPRQSELLMRRASEFSTEAISRQYLTLFDTAMKQTTQAMHQPESNARQHS